MTLKQKLAAEKILENPSKPLGQVMREVGYSENTAIAPEKNLMSSKGWQEIKEQYRQTLIASGMDHNKLVAKMNEWINAQKPFSSHTEPDKMVPDYQTQIKAGEMWREDLGLTEKSPIQVLNQGEMTVEFIK